MAHAHYVVLFAGLMFGNNPAANDRSGVTQADRAIGDRSKPHRPKSNTLDGTFARRADSSMGGGSIF
jgi:hypothetical protein